MRRLTLIFLVALTTEVLARVKITKNGDMFSCQKYNFKFGSQNKLTQNSSFVIMPGVEDYKLQVEYPLVKMRTELVGMQLMICDSSKPRIQIFTMEPDHPMNTFVMIKRKSRARGEAFGVMQGFFHSTPFPTKGSKLKE